MIELVDQMNNKIRLETIPERILSLVPSQTELLAELGMEDKVVGITKFCIHPKSWFETKTRVGGTKQVDFERIRSLDPELIIANKEENTKEMIDLLKEDYPVYVSDIYTIEDSFKMMDDLGILVGKTLEAVELVDKIKEAFVALPAFSGNVLYFMWNDPYMVAGEETFIGDILRGLGLTNLYDDPKGRYREISLKEIKEMEPDYILLSSEPFPFTDKHKEILEKELETKIILVDGEMFSWYGSRMKFMPDYFKTLQPLFQP